MQRGRPSMCWLHCCGGRKSGFCLANGKKKRAIRKKMKLQSSQVGLMKGLDLHSLHTLTPTDENQGLVFKNENQGLQQHHYRWWEWYCTCNLAAGQERNATLLPGTGRHAPEAEKTLPDICKIQVGHHGSSVFGEGGRFVPDQPQVGPRKDRGRKRPKLRTQDLPKFRVKPASPWAQATDSSSRWVLFSAYSPNPASLPLLPPVCFPRTRFAELGPTSTENTLLSGWHFSSSYTKTRIRLNNIVWRMLVSPNSKAQLLEFSELFFFPPYPVCKQHKLVIKKIQPSESFMMVWAREKFADQRL